MAVIRMRRLAVASALTLFLMCPTARGTVTFGDPRTYTVGLSPTAVVMGDFNGDGKPDIAVTVNGSGVVSVLLGNGDGTFQTAKNSLAGTNPAAVVVGDFNRDGKMDLVVASNAAPFTVSILLGNGDGTFQTPVTLNASSQTAMTLAAGDLNKDGKLDLIVTRTDSSADNLLSVLLGNGDGTFKAAIDTTLSVAGGAASISPVVADFNGDGKPDVVAVLPSNKVFMLLGNGDGSFQPPTITNAGFGIRTLSVGDFNGDAKPDVEVVTTTHIVICFFPPCAPSPVQPEILLGNGDGSLQPARIAGGLVQTSGAVTGDFNGDGKLDLATITAGSTNLTILIGGGEGTFISVSGNASDTVPSAIASADLNGDHLTDLILLDGANAAVKVLLNTSPTTGADLGVALGLTTQQPNEGVVGQNLTYNLSAQNLGPQTATNTIVSDTLPSGMTLVSATPDQGDCTGAAQITCNLGSVASGKVEHVAIVATPTVTGSLTDLASISSDLSDSNMLDDNASNSLSIVPGAALHLTIAGNGTVISAPSGANCSANCSTVFPAGTDLNLLAAAGTGAGFGGWMGACSFVNGTQCSLTLNSDASVTATFGNFHTLTVQLTDTGTGTISSTPAGISCGLTCIDEFAAGTNVNLKAAVALGSKFVSWSGACTGTDPNQCSVSMTDDLTVTADVEISPDFSVNLPPNPPQVASGSSQMLTVNVASNGSFTSAVNLSCNVSPALALCSVSPTSVTPGNSATLTFSAVEQLEGSAPQPVVPPAAGSPLLFGVVFLAFVLAGLSLGLTARGRKWRWALVSGSALLAILLLQTACGGGASQGPPPIQETPPGDYTVTVTGTFSTEQQFGQTVITVH